MIPLLSVLKRAISAVIVGAVSAVSALAQDHVVEQSELRDRKAVFATVESVDTLAARARLSGTIGELRVDEGDRVEAQHVIAVVVDEQLAPQIGALNAQLAALTARLDQARADLERDENLFERGLVAEARLEAARTEVSVLGNQVRSAREQRAITVQRAREGDVLAPVAGVVLNVPVTAGAVVLPGEVIAEIASEVFVMRLSVPERHAQFVEVGDRVHLASEAGREGIIRQVYPRIQAGRLTADALVDGMDHYFVGQRVQVWIETEPRSTIVIPENYIMTRYGLDYVQIRIEEEAVRPVVVQRGGRHRSETGVPLIEILSGLKPGDVLVQP